MKLDRLYASLLSGRAGFFLCATLVVIFFGLPLFEKLGTTDLKGDEPIYAFGVDRMLDQGDWLTPKSIPYDRNPFLEKPPLKFWIVAGSMRAGLLPHDEFGQRFWDALFGVAAFLYVLALGFRAGGAICGLTAVLVLFVHQPLIIEHGLRSANMEAPLLLAYCGGVYHALAWLRSRLAWQRWLHPLAFGLWFVLGFMTKFVAVIFLPAIVLAPLVVSREWRHRALEDWKPWIVAGLMAAALIAPWFVYQYRLRDAELWQVIFGVHVLQRFTSFLDPAHLHPWYYYFAEMYKELLASHTLVLVAAGLAVLIYQVLRYRSDVALILLVWFALPLVAISSGTSKLYHYVYPFLPPLAIAAGLVPVAIAEAAGQYLGVMTRWLERVWPPVRARRLHPHVRRLLTWIALAAVTLAIITPLVGSVTLRARSGAILFRSATVLRPMIVAAPLLMIVGLPANIPRMLVIVVILSALPVDAYRHMRALIADPQPSVMRPLRQCLLDLQARGAPKGVYLHTADAGQWKYYYYLREPGLTNQEANDDAKFAARLFVPGERRPVFLAVQDYIRLRGVLDRSAGDGAAVRALDAVPRILYDDDRLILLPGEYSVCAPPAAAAGRH